MKAILCCAALLLASLTACAADGYSFGVLSQRSPVLTAEYWNPILAYVTRKTGIELELRVARTALESNQAIGRGDYDFAYSNHIFKPTNLAQNYQVILKPRAEAITGQIVTLENSVARAPADLNGHEVGFPSKAAFVAYAVPMDYLMRSGITVTPVFGNNQEGIMAQLRAGKVVAAAVNSQVMAAYSAREGLRYRVLWQSEAYDNIPVAVHPRVPKPVALSVQQTLDGMVRDPDGARILGASAAMLQQRPPFGFMVSSQNEYRNYLQFYHRTVVADFE
jgi:phosphonate transport system substrate-binding protein